MAAATSVVTNSYHTKPPCELTTSISPASLSAALSRRAAQGAGRTRDRFTPRSSCPTVDWLTPGSTAVRRCAQRNWAAYLLGASTTSDNLRFSAAVGARADVGWSAA